MQENYPKCNSKKSHLGFDISTSGGFFFTKPPGVLNLREARIYHLPGSFQLPGRFNNIHFSAWHEGNCSSR